MKVGDKILATKKVVSNLGSLYWAYQIKSKIKRLSPVRAGHKVGDFEKKFEFQ